MTTNLEHYKAQLQFVCKAEGVDPSTTPMGHALAVVEAVQHKSNVSKRCVLCHSTPQGKHFEHCPLAYWEAEAEVSGE